MFTKCFYSVALFVVLANLAMAADIVDGTVLAYDRQAKILVFTDKRVWSLETLEAPAPESLKAGDRVEVRFESNEDDGITLIHSLKILP